MSGGDSDFARHRPHPWHGLPVGPQPPGRLYAFVEITRYDLVKYELDKRTGYLTVDRPQQTSSLPPSCYGFVPRTLCGPRVAGLSEHTDTADGDPLDICVLSEQPINRAELLLNTRVLGGLHTIDRGEADDKIVGVLDSDTNWGRLDRLDDLPDGLVRRLEHYFNSYKTDDRLRPQVEVKRVYGRDEACGVVDAAIADYRDAYGDRGWA